MRLSDSVVAFLCLFLTVLMWFLALPLFTTVYAGIDNDRVDWYCDRPITNLSPPPVDLDEVRSELAALDAAGAAADETVSTDKLAKVESLHPQCVGLVRTQVGLGLISALLGLWRARRWWIDTADARAERKFKRLHEQAGKPPSRLF